jgi:hypothetical protein
VAPTSRVPGPSCGHSITKLLLRKFYPDEADPGDVATRPVEAGDEAIPDWVATNHKIIGTMVVAALAASAEGVLPTIRATCRRRRSANRSSHVDPRPGGAQWRRSGPRHSQVSFMPWWNAVTRSNAGSDASRRNPITGMAGCCARAASGQAAAAPPRSVMNSRRFICCSSLKRTLPDESG